MKVVQYLNSECNTVSKGRSDLGVEILESARSLATDSSLSAIGNSVTEAWDELVTYFSGLDESLDYVNAHLYSNKPMVALFAKYEEAFETAMHYLLHDEVPRSSFSVKNYTDLLLREKRPQEASSP